jgi:hypothetical protein
VLAPELMAAIAWADPLIPHHRLAQLLGVTSAQVGLTRRRVWRDGPVCRIYWVTCGHCGGLIAADGWTMRFHPWCLTTPIGLDALPPPARESAQLLEGPPPGDPGLSANQRSERSHPGTQHRQLARRYAREMPRNSAPRRRPQPGALCRGHRQKTRW